MAVSAKDGSGNYPKPAVGRAANGDIVDVLVAADGGAALAPIAGERGINTANDYQLVRPGATLSIISKTTAVTIGAGAANDTRLHGLTFVAALTGSCIIDGFTDSDGVAQAITFPAGSAAGYKDFFGNPNTAGALIITCSNVADDNLVLVHWSAI